ncbi:MAG: enoyl-CoA hydratase [Methylocystaceae bacterium]|nr:MAG: enoyl-CoA hydratase [Methylocystaceae bacterium]
MPVIIETIDTRGVATLTLNRPERHNALDQTLVTEMIAALKRLDARPDVRIVVLAGAGHSFCAGGDIDRMKSVADGDPEENRRDALLLAELTHRLDRLSKPTLAVVHGPAYGGGVGLVACCDIAIASQSATFSLSEVRLGITPSVVCPFVIRAIGARQARRYFVSAEVMFAERAAEIGLVHEVVALSELIALRDRIVDALLTGAPGAQAEAKVLSSYCEYRRIDDALARETAERLAARRASPEGREGLSAFLEKRPPAWRRTRNDRDVS